MTTIVAGFVWAATEQHSPKPAVCEREATEANL